MKEIKDSLIIPVVLGTAREGRESLRVANYFVEKLKENNIKTSLFDVKDFISSSLSERELYVQKWQETINNSDGLVVVTPEYNHSYPGELKILLDTLYKEYARKPMGICTVSSGSIGGARAGELIKLLAVNFNMAPLNNVVYVPNIKSIPQEEIEKTIGEKTKTMIDDLLWWADALKNARINV